MGTAVAEALIYMDKKDVDKKIGTELPGIPRHPQASPGLGVYDESNARRSVHRAPTLVVPTLECGKQARLPHREAHARAWHD